MDHLNQSERRIWEHIKSKAHLRRSDQHLDKLLSMMTDFLRTINELRESVIKIQTKSNQMEELARARQQAYDSSCQDRVRLVDENRFLRDKLEQLKR